MTTTPTIAASAIITLISPSERPEAPDLIVAAAADELPAAADDLPGLALVELEAGVGVLVGWSRLENGGNETGGFAALQIT